MDHADLSIFPNPASSYLSVTSIGKIQDISVFTMTGQKVKDFKLSNTQGVENNLYIGDLQSGIYFLQIRNSDGQAVTRKMIKRP